MLKNAKDEAAKEVAVSYSLLSVCTFAQQQAFRREREEDYQKMISEVRA